MSPAPKLKPSNISTAAEVETLAKKLTDHREAVYLSRRLTRIACDLKLGTGVEGLLRASPDMDALCGLYDQLGFGPFLRRQGERLAQLPAA